MSNNSYSESRAYNAGIAQEVGLNAAVAYGQLYHWKQVMKGRRFYKKYQEMTDETTLSKYQLNQAYKKLAAAGYIEFKVAKAGNAPTCHFRVFDRLTKSESKETSLSENQETSLSMESEETALSYNNKDKNSTKAEAVERVFSLYKESFTLPNVKLTDGRRKKISARLQDAGPEMLKAAIINTSKSKFHRGEGPNGWKADIDWIIRAYENVEKMSMHVSSKPGKKSLLDQMAEDRKHQLLNSASAL